jgi:hypothetical protein
MNLTETNIGAELCVSRIGGSAGDLGVLLSLRRVLAAFQVVILAVKLRGRAMRFGCALVVFGRFCVYLIGHVGLRLSG